MVSRTETKVEIGAKIKRLYSNAPERQPWQSSYGGRQCRGTGFAASNALRLFSRQSDNRRRFLNFFRGDLGDPHSTSHNIGRAVLSL